MQAYNKLMVMGFCLFNVIGKSLATPDATLTFYNQSEGSPIVIVYGTNREETENALLQQILEVYLRPQSGLNQQTQQSDAPITQPISIPWMPQLGAIPGGNIVQLPQSDTMDTALDLPFAIPSIPTGFPQLPAGFPQIPPGLSQPPAGLPATLPQTPATEKPAMTASDEQQPASELNVQQILSPVPIQPPISSFPPITAQGPLPLKPLEGIYPNLPNRPGGGRNYRLRRIDNDESEFLNLVN